jgi:hypothetical protein
MSMSRGNTAYAARGGVVEQIGMLEEWLAHENEILLKHRYFELCATRGIGREQTLEIVKQLFCFSVFFERVLTRRLAEYSSQKDPRVAEIARHHLREEIGHSILFRECLLENGMSDDEIERIDPKMFTKALFGYLLATVAHESEHVTNVAIMQVMETIGYHFFRSTLEVMKGHGMLSRAFVEHADADEDHRHLGLDLAASFDEQTMNNCRRIIEDIYRLMGFVLSEWLDEPLDSASLDTPSGSTMRASRITAIRPPVTEEVED